MCSAANSKSKDVEVAGDALGDWADRGMDHVAQLQAPPDQHPAQGVRAVLAGDRCHRGVCPAACRPPSGLYASVTTSCAALAARSSGLVEQRMQLDLVDRGG